MKMDDHFHQRKHDTDDGKGLIDLSLQHEFGKPFFLASRLESNDLISLQIRKLSNNLCLARVKWHPITYGISRDGCIH